MTLVTAEELSTRMRVPVDQFAAELACESATAIIQNLTRQHLLAAEHTDTFPVEMALRAAPYPLSDHPGAGLSATLRLWQRPVKAVLTVELDGVTLDADQWWWDGEATVWLTTGDSGVEGKVTYEAGYDTPPRDLRAVALAIAANEYTQVSDAIAMERLADYQVSYRVADDAAVTGRQKVILSRYAASVSTLRLG